MEDKFSDICESSNNHTATITALLSTVGHVVLSIANIFGIRESGRIFNQRRVGSQTRSSFASVWIFVTNTRAHSVVRAGMLADVTGRLRRDEADDEGLLFCAEGRSDSDGAPKTEAVLLRCLLAGRDVARFDIEERRQDNQPGIGCI